MDLREYQRLAMRTANMKISNELILANRALGLSGEASEFSAHVFRKIVFGDSFPAVDAAKELGDVMWYAATTAEAVGLQLDELRDDGECAKLVGLTLEKLTIGLNVSAGEVADIFKKHLTHGHALETKKVASALYSVVFLVNKLATATGCGTLDDICRWNIDKLKKRYPEGFDEERSQKRAD